MKRALSLFLALVLVLALIPAARLAGSNAYGTEVWLRDTELQGGVTYSDNIFWSATYNGPRHEHYFTYVPYGGSEIRPVAAWGNSVCERVTTSNIAQRYEEQGWRVVGAINGDFYSWDGCPVGVVVSDGRLLTGSDHNEGIHPDGRKTCYAVGFRRDGSVVMGEPKLSISAVNNTTGAAIPLASINRPQAETWCANIITYDYRDDHTTGPLVSGASALATIQYGEPAIGGSVTVEVERVLYGDEPVVMAQNQVVLSAASGGFANQYNFVRTLNPGDTVTVSFKSLDEENDWSEVTEAVGALYLLLKDGEIQGGLPSGTAPRTAVGLRPDGSLLLYTVDGRQNTVSVGSTLSVLAMRLQELGCEMALCLDGGGSTTAVASLPGDTKAQLLNSPSDGLQRRNPNHILLLAPGQPTYAAGEVYLSTNTPAVLTGGIMVLSGGVMDSHYFPYPGEVGFYASDGYVENGLFYAPAQSGPVTLYAYWDRLESQLGVQVIDVPDSAVIRSGGNEVSSLTLLPGVKVQLGITATYNHLPLAARVQDFTWTVDPALGAIDEKGVLTTSRQDGHGTITASRGSFSVSIPLTLDWNTPFVDTQGHWAAAYMADMYHQGILQGTKVDGKSYAYPDQGVTREEFATMLARYLKLDLSIYDGYEMPFADEDQISSWALPAVCAMYDLGIVNGVSENDELRFAPHRVLSRDQAMTMIGRMMSALGVPAYDTDLSQFTDAASVPGYAQEHFKTLVALGVIGGSDGRLDPAGQMTRAAVCKVLDTLPDPDNLPAPETEPAPEPQPEPEPDPEPQQENPDPENPAPEQPQPEEPAPEAPGE